MKQIFTVVLVAAGLLMTGARANAQTKIGYISMQELIPAMPEYKKADTTLGQFREALYLNAQEKQNTLNDAAAKFTKDSATMTAAVKEIKRKELQLKFQELQGEDQRLREELQRKEEELIAPIQKKAMDAVQAVAKENGYTYVIGREAILVAPPGDDLLPLVKKKMNLK